MSTNKRVFTALVNFIDSLADVYDDETRYKFLHNYNLLLNKMTLGDVDAIDRHLTALKQYLEFNRTLLIEKKLEDAIEPYDKMVLRQDVNGRPKIYIDFALLIGEAPSEAVVATIYQHLYHITHILFPDWSDIPSGSSGGNQRDVPTSNTKLTMDEAKGKVKDIIGTVKTTLGNVDKSKGWVGAIEMFTGDNASTIFKQFEEITSSNLDGKQMATVALQALQESINNGDMDIGGVISGIFKGSKTASSAPRLTPDEVVEMAEKFKRIDQRYDEDGGEEETEVIVTKKVKSKKTKPKVEEPRDSRDSREPREPVKQIASKKKSKIVIAETEEDDEDL